MSNCANREEELVSLPTRYNPGTFLVPKLQLGHAHATKLCFADRTKQSFV